MTAPAAVNVLLEVLCSTVALGAGVGLVWVLKRMRLDLEDGARRTAEALVTGLVEILREEKNNDD